ncbi:MAG: glucose 1-dehydrogenase [Acidobacteriia bacterium]|nr:glucose 1-dehydrogenase [Terriglobia bacterium]
MKAVAVFPGKPNSIHLTEMPKPTVSEIPVGRGVLVKVLRVGVDGTDKEINAAEYGAAPEGFDFLVVGHESFGVVEEIGAGVTEFSPGDYVVATVRRPGLSLYDQIGLQDMTTDGIYFERGINLRHGYMAEYYSDAADYLVRIPVGLKEVGVLLEPVSVVVKGINQAYEIQRRLKVWHPRKAAVMGAGPIGLLASLSLRLRGLDVTVFSKEPKPNHRSELVERIGARYVGTGEAPLKEVAGKYGPFDIIFEATGYSPVVFEAMELVSKNGVLVLSSITGGQRTAQVPTDKINLDFVLGNKVVVGTVNASRHDFQESVRDMAMAEASYPGWLGYMLTHPVQGLENFRELYTHLSNGALKAFVQVAGP